MKDCAVSHALLYSIWSSGNFTQTLKSQEPYGLDLTSGFRNWIFALKRSFRVGDFEAGKVSESVCEMLPAASTW